MQTDPELLEARKQASSKSENDLSKRYLFCLPVLKSTLKTTALSWKMYASEKISIGRALHIHQPDWSPDG